MKSVYLICAVAILVYCNTARAQEPADPNLMWVSDSTWKHGFRRFLVHPNGNILAGVGSTEVELDGNTGKIIRQFSYPAVFYDISPDGKYISALTDQRCVIDYETEEVIVRFTKFDTHPQFMPDSKTLVYFLNEPIGQNLRHGNLRLASYNIETKGYKSGKNFIRYTLAIDIAVSPDGKYIATSGLFFGPGGKEYIRLILWDAQTLDTIRILADLESRFDGSIKFSPDSRLVGFQVYLDDLYIYKTDDYSLFKHYGGLSVFGFCFLPNNLLGYANVTAGGSTDPLYTRIENLNTSELLYNDSNWGNDMEYNPRYNTWLVKRYRIDCYNLQKILAGASIEPEIQNPFTVEYLNNSLSIRNYTFGTNSINCSITDINGRVIRNINLNTSMGDIRIPIKLLSGTYFLHIKDGSKEYVSKFLVTN